MGDTVTDIISSTANAYGIPSWIPLDIAKRESSLNPNTYGDYAQGRPTSFGLFQLHRGGLAPSNISNEDLLNPYTNSDIAIKAMVPAYQRGISQGLTGLPLLEYTANTSGWPGNLGVIVTNKIRPDYNAGLSAIYYGMDSEQQTAAAAAAAATTYEQSAKNNKTAQFFDSFSQSMNIQSYEQWKTDSHTSAADKINPFAYFLSQGSKIWVRLLVVLFGLIFVLFAVYALSQEAIDTGGEAGALNGLSNDIQ